MLAKRVTKNFVMLFSGNVISQAIIFYGLIRIATTLTPEEFGRFSFAQAISTFFVRCTEFGMETIAVRRIAQRENDSFLVENVFSIRFLMSVAVIAVSYAFLVLSSGSADANIIFILLISLIGISLTTEWYFQAHERMEVVSMIRIVRALIFVVPFLLLSKDYHSDIFVSWLFSISFIVVAFFFLGLYVRKEGFALSGITLSRMMSLIKESAPIGLAITLMQIPYNYGTFIIGVTMAKADVGAYSAAYRPVLAFWSFGIIAAYQAFFPVINSLIRDVPVFENFVMKLTKIFVLSGVALFLLVAPFGEWIIEILYGGKFAGTGYILQLSLIIITIVLSRAAIEYSLVSMKKQKEYLRGMLFVSGMYGVFCYVGATVGGIAGVLYAAIISELLYTGYIFYQVKSFERWAEYGALLAKAAFIAASSALVFVVPSALRFPIKLVVAYAVFAAGVWLLKIITASEVVGLIRMFRR